MSYLCNISRHLFFNVVSALKMKVKFVDCFMLMGTALSLRGDQSVSNMGNTLLQDVFTTTVNVSITLSEIYFKNLYNMEVQLTFLLHQRWIDPRLGANQRTRTMAVNGKIWSPKITATEGEMHIFKNDMTLFWRGTEPDGKILHSEKVILDTFCTTNFKNFPFDTQKCMIKLGTYRFPKDEVDLIWNQVPVELFTGENLKEFKLIDINTYSEIEIRPSGNFTVLVAEITIKRFYEHYLYCIIGPCSFLVFISYFVFWLNPKIMNIRYFISSANLLLLIYFYHYSSCIITSNLSYMKAIDIFVLLCNFFVFFALVQNIIIDIMYRNDNCDEYGSSRYFHKTAKSSYNSRYKLLDRIASVMYPTFFMCIVLFYCMVFIV